MADVSQRQPLRQAVKDMEAALGPVDVLLACAGFGTLTLVPDLALDTLRRTFEVNLFGVAESIEAVLPGMLTRGKGHLVGVASLAGYRGFPWMISYSASKAGLIAYLEAIHPACAAGNHGHDGLPGLCQNGNEHARSLQAEGQDAGAGTGRPAPGRARFCAARATASFPGTCGSGWPFSGSCPIASSIGACGAPGPKPLWWISDRRLKDQRGRHAVNRTGCDCSDDQRAGAVHRLQGAAPGTRSLPVVRPGLRYARRHHRGKRAASRPQPRRRRVLRWSRLDAVPQVGGACSWRSRGAQIGANVDSPSSDCERPTARRAFWRLASAMERT